MSFATVKLLGFAPDLPPDTPGAIVAQSGMIPTVRGFSSGPILGASQTADMASRSLGVFSPKQVNGTQRWFIGTATKIWESNSTGSSLTDRSLTAYSASATQTWSFCQFGDVTLATNLGNALGQINAGGAFATVTGGGTPPKASIIINAGPATAPFVLAFNYDDGSVHADGLFNSGLADYTGWTVGTNQCATLRALEPAGPFVAAIAYRDGAIAFKDNAMFEVTYSAVAATPGWSFRRIASDIGICGKNMCVNVNDTIYFADKRGFWMYDGSYPKKLPGYIHDHWSVQVRGGRVDDSTQLVWDPTRHNLWASYRLSADSTAQANWLVWNQLSGLWAKQTTISNGAAGGTVKTARQIISFETAPLTTTISTDTKYTCDTFAYDQATCDATTVQNPPSLQTWYIGDPIGYTEITRVSPVWLGTSPSASSSILLLGSKRVGQTGSHTVGPALIDSNFLYFDALCSDNWISVEIDAYGAYEFLSVGLSTTQTGQRGTR